VFPQIVLHLTPKELNKVQFAVKIWQENAEVTSGLNHFLDKGALFSKIRLTFEDSTCITTHGLWVALLTLHEKAINL
jgi:hypothetical protein